MENTMKSLPIESMPGYPYMITRAVRDGLTALQAARKITYWVNAGLGNYERNTFARCLIGLRIEKDRRYAQAVRKACYRIAGQVAESDGGA